MFHSFPCPALSPLPLMGLLSGPGGLLVFQEVHVTALESDVPPAETLQLPMSAQQGSRYFSLTQRQEERKNLWHFMVVISPCEAMSHTYVSTAPTGSELFPFCLHYACRQRSYSRQLCFRDCPSLQCLLASEQNFSSNCCNNTLQKAKQTKKRWNGGCLLERQTTSPPISSHNEYSQI